MTTATGYLPPAERSRPPGTVAALSVGFTVFVVALHVAIPKAGFKVGKVPLTFADLALIPLLLLGAIQIARGRRPQRAFARCALLVFAGCLLFAARITVPPLLYGRPLSADDLGFVTALAIYPLIFVFIAIFIPPSNARRFFRVISLCVMIVLLYGMAQKAFGPYRVVVPGITANWSDAKGGGDFLAQKDNVISATGALKLSSTYQNGNLLGINLLLLLPLAVAAAEPRWLKPALVALGAVALVLTGSRAVWVGGLVALLIALRPTPKTLIPKLTLGIALWFAGGIVLFHTPLGRDRVSRMSRANLESWGGRLNPAAVLWRGSIQGDDLWGFMVGPYGERRAQILASGGHAYEIVYLAIYQEAGFIGLVLWLIPICLCWRGFFRWRHDPYIRAILIGLVAWMCAAIADGAFWLPPTAFNLWCLLGLGWLRVGWLWGLHGVGLHRRALRLPRFEANAPALPQ